MNLNQRLREISASKHLYATEGVMFGDLLGSEFTFPKHPEHWTMRQLEALRSRQTEAANDRLRNALEEAWGRILNNRKQILGENYALRINRFSLPSEAVKAEFLELEPAIARQALAEAVCYENPDLAIAGDNLYRSCEALLETASFKGTMPQRCILPPKQPLCVSNIHQLTETDNTLDWPLDVRVIRLSQDQFVVWLGELGTECPAFQGHTHFWVSGQAGVMALEQFLDELLSYFRQSLLARVTIGISIGTSGLSMESRPLEGLIVRQGYYAYELMCLKNSGAGGYSLVNHEVMPCEMHRVSLPADDAHRRALVDQVFHLWASPYREFPSLLSFDVHLSYVAPLAQVKPPHSSSEDDDLLALATDEFEVVAKHVQRLDDGRYHVTRHALVSPFSLVVTEDIEFAIGLALAHEVSFPLRLSLGL